MRFKGRDIDVTFNMLRCTHVAECLRRLPGVFDTDRRPWIAPDAAPPDAVAETVMACPTGALHFERLDGGPDEPTPETNTITVAEDGPLFLRGRIELLDSDGKPILSDTRLALCRCGGTRRPYCDGSHRTSGFRKPCALADCDAGAPMKGDDDGTLRVASHRDGPHVVEGTFELIAGDVRKRFGKVRVALCGCGRTRVSPFCDGAHAHPDR
ncbi:MAG: CDGSH iron-sulfur domain-containing protein [Planctomycetota bacterium]